MLSRPTTALLHSRDSFRRYFRNYLNHFCGLLADELEDDMASTMEQRLSIVYGPRAPVPLTLTFGQLLDHHAEVRPDHPAVISHVQGCTITFGQLQKRSIKLAKAMAEAGIRRGSLVGIISGTRYEYLEVSVPN